MKNIYLICLLLLSTVLTYAQMPDGITYQAVAIDENGKEIAGRDINGNILHSKAIAVRFTILRNSPDGELLYQEEHETHTDHNGLFSLVIGKGLVLSEISNLLDIDWQNGPMFLKVEMDVKMRGQFKLMGVQEMMAVPYAYHANTASTIQGGYDSDETNELQFLSLSNDTIYLSDGGFVKLPSSFTGEFSKLKGVPEYLDIDYTDDFSGDFNDLSNAPINLSYFNNDEGFITTYTETDPTFNTSAAKSITNAGSGSVITSDERTKLNSLDANAKANVQGDWSEVNASSDAFIKNKPFITNVAISGDYNDLSNKPTNLSEFNNDEGFITSFTEADPSFNASAAKSITNAGSGSVITSDERTKLNTLDVNAEVNVQGDWNEVDVTSDGFIKNKPIFTNVATSGDYLDLSNRPANLSDFNNDEGFITSFTELDPTFDASAAKSIINAGSGSVITSVERAKLISLNTNAEVNIQGDWNELDATSDAFIKNKPIITNVATSGDYNDLINRPANLSDFNNDEGFISSYTEIDPSFNASAAKSITDSGSGSVITTLERTKLNSIDSNAEINVQGDWNEVDASSDAFIKNKPTISNVATSGDYNDLSNKPTNLSQFNNDEGFITSYTEIDPSFNASAAKSITDSGSGSVITTSERTKLNSLDASAEVNVQGDWNEVDASSDAFIKNKPIFTNVATTGDYNDLSNKPTNLSQFNNDEGYISSYTETDPSFNASAAKSITDSGSGNVITSAERTKLSSLSLLDLVPAGSIMAYGGNTIPSGWILCDGREIDRTSYSALYSVIGENWGAGNGSSTFNIPDLRGQFLRGVSGDSNTDPDATERTSKLAGGNSGNLVGSYQNDETKAHNHSGVINTVPCSVGAIPEGVATNHSCIKKLAQSITDDVGGDETRPLNAYVYYMIKY